METFLLKFFYLARPLLNGFVNFPIFGLNFFEFATIVFTVILMIVFFASITSRENPPMSSVEVWMVVLIVWCTFISLINFELTVFKSYVKWILPPITYIVLKRSLGDRVIHSKLLTLLMLGFIVPIGISAVVTFQGGGIDEEIFQTGTVRYRGIYNGIHEMGHNTGFAIMLVVICATLGRIRRDVLPIRRTWLRYGLMALLVVLAVYCLIHTYVRTVYVGLTVFFAVFLFFYSKKMLVLAAAAAVAIVIGFTAVFTTIFFDVLDTKFVGENYERAGSGRFSIWSGNMDIWYQAPMDKKLIGLGIGNWAGNRIPTPDDGFPQINNSHNDWLEVMLETGIIGLIIVVGLYLAILQTILAVDGREKYAIVALYCAVLVMNFFSNSYISRVPIAQLFYMVIVYVELRAPKEEFVAIASQQPQRRRVLRYKRGTNA